MPDTRPPVIAAIVTRASGEANRLIADFAVRHQAAGWRIRGLIQEQPACDDGCRIFVVDLDDGTRYPITQDLGPGAESCGLDPSLIAEASGVMRRIESEGADLAVFNRFGGLEAEGGGFAAEMLSLMAGGIPVLAIVPDRHLAQWREFTGGLSAELPPSATALDAWFFAQKRAVHRSSEVIPSPSVI